MHFVRACVRRDTAKQCPIRSSILFRRNVDKQLRKGNVKKASFRMSIFVEMRSGLSEICTACRVLLEDTARCADTRGQAVPPQTSWVNEQPQGRHLLSCVETWVLATVCHH